MICLICHTNKALKGDAICKPCYNEEQAGDLRYEWRSDERARSDQAAMSTVPEIQRAEHIPTVRSDTTREDEMD